MTERAAIPETRERSLLLHLARDPSRYDVIVATNFYADILSDLASELSGSLGLAGSINANAEAGLVCAQAQHGSVPALSEDSVPKTRADLIGFLTNNKDKLRGKVATFDSCSLITRTFSFCLGRV